MPPSADSAPVVVFTDGPDWHLKALKRALGRRGIVPVVASLRDVAFDVGAREPVSIPVSIPGTGGRFPRAVLVRGIAAGSFEAITLRLGVLHELEAAGVLVWNPARAIERCVDKSATSVALIRAGLPTPRTFVSENAERALDFLDAELAAGHFVVSKPLFGSQGKGIRLLTAREDLPQPEAVSGVYYLQRFLPPADGRFRDMRVFVSGGAAVAGMIRRSQTWITNVHQGATPEPYVVPAAAERLAVAAARSVGAAFAGVDLIEDGDGLSVLEVNSMPAWSGLQSVAAPDIADRLIADFLRAAGIAGREPELPV
jgi:RimK family alpha-L-glutamate ligase